MQSNIEEILHNDVMHEFQKSINLVRWVVHTMQLVVIDVDKSQSRRSAERLFINQYFNLHNAALLSLYGNM